MGTIDMKDLSIGHFETIIDLVYDQVTAGKGKERHGQNTEFSQQPWRHISDNVGEGFCLGQAIKKLMELKYHSDKMSTSLTAQELASAFSKWKTDAVGAIVYTIMAIMHKEHKLDGQAESRVRSSAPSTE